jgi:predicted DNA-binding transcriptional regulator AlpA
LSLVATSEALVMSPKNPERLLTTRDAAELVGLQPATLIAWRSRGTPGRPQPVRLGTRSIRYREADVLAWRDRESAVRDYSDRKAGRKKRGS